MGFDVIAQIKDANRNTQDAKSYLMKESNVTKNKINIGNNLHTTKSLNGRKKNLLDTQNKTEERKAQEKKEDAYKSKQRTGEIKLKVEERKKTGDQKNIQPDSKSLTQSEIMVKNEKAGNQINYRTIFVQRFPLDSKEG